MKRSEAIEHLNIAFNLLAPDKKVQEKLVQIRNEMEIAGEDEKKICLTISYAIADGLKYGNW